MIGPSHADTARPRPTVGRAFSSAILVRGLRAAVIAEGGIRAAGPVVTVVAPSHEIIESADARDANVIIVGWG